MVEKADRKSRLIVSGDVLPPGINPENLTKKWEGYIYVEDINSEVAKKINALVQGKYALKIGEK